MQSIEAIQQRQCEVLQAMGRIQVMRRGTVSTQEYSQRRKRKGGAGATGPYWLWQGSIGGKHFSQRVSAQEGARFAQEIEQRREFERLSAEYVALGEALAKLLGEQDQQRVQAEEEVKKKSRQPSTKTRK